MATNKKNGKSNNGARATGKRLTQSEIINLLAQKFEMKRVDVKEFLTELASLAGKEVKKNGEFGLPGFGKLVLVKRKARDGRNPATGETIKIPAKTMLKFRIGKAMKDSVATVKKK